MKKKTNKDDIGFDATGQVCAIGDEAAAGSERIVDHPDAIPVLVVATLNGDVGVRVYGPPCAATADILDDLAVIYRKAVDAAHQVKQ